MKKSKRRPKPYVKPPSKEELDLPAFNHWLKSQGLRQITLVEYLNYLHGKGLPTIENRPKDSRKPFVPRLEIPEDRDPRKLPSVEQTPGVCTFKKTRHSLNKEYLIAVAYNKGPTMVMTGKEDLKTAGRKV
jgi:hypothetical protein